MKAFEVAAGMCWALEPEALRTLLAVARREGSEAEAVAARAGRRMEGARTVTVRDGVAVVPVVGPIFRRANLFTEISGATSIELMATDFTRALEDPAVKAILLDIDSPGGEVNGTGEFAALVRKGAKVEGDGESYRELVAYSHNAPDRGVVEFGTCTCGVRAAEVRVFVMAGYGNLHQPRNAESWDHTTVDWRGRELQTARG